MECEAAEVARAESHALGGAISGREKKEWREKVSKKRIRITFGGAEHESVAEDKVGVKRRERRHISSLGRQGDATTVAIR